MAERAAIECGCGRGFTSTVRGRGTHCPGCGRTVYVRTDGTVRAAKGVPPPTAGSRATARKVAQTSAVVADPGPPDHTTATDEQWLARELWESHRLEGISIAQLVEESGPPMLTAAKVRQLIAAEEQRQRTAVGAKRAARPPAGARPAGNPRRRRQAA